MGEQQRDVSPGTDKRLLTTLQESGPQTIERLAALPGMSWSQVFLAIDRMSRVGSVLLQQSRRCEYRVSIKREAA